MPDQTPRDPLDSLYRPPTQAQRLFVLIFYLFVATLSVAVAALLFDTPIQKNPITESLDLEAPARNRRIAIVFLITGILAFYLAYRAAFSKARRLSNRSVEVLGILFIASGVVCIVIGVITSDFAGKSSAMSVGVSGVLLGGRVLHRQKTQN